MKEKYPVSGFTRDKEAIYVNGIRIFLQNMKSLKRLFQKRDIKLFLSYQLLLE